MILTIFVTSINNLKINKMNDREHSNVFRFSLYQEDVLLSEKIFDADQFNPFTRYSINIRDILPRTINRFQKILSRRSYDVQLDIGRKDITKKDSPSQTYDLFRYHQKMVNTYPKEWRDGIRYSPKSKTYHIEQKVIRGVECKIGLYINDNPIVERVFYVDGFNPVARWSVDINDMVIEIADLISEKIKKNDIKNMWDDYDLINKRGLSITQIRELSIGKREDLLRRLRR